MKKQTKFRWRSYVWKCSTSSLEKWLKPDELGRVELACHSFLLVIDGIKVLFELGIGCFEPKLAQRYGVYTSIFLLENLSQQGFHTKRIDYL